MQMKMGGNRPGAGNAPRSAGRGGMGGQMPAQNPSAAEENDRGLKRTEFVILFIWKEPTESDRLRNLPSGDQGGGAAADSAPPRHLRPKPKKNENDKKNDNPQKGA